MIKCRTIYCFRILLNYSLSDQLSKEEDLTELHLSSEEEKEEEEKEEDDVSRTSRTNRTNRVE